MAAGIGSTTRGKEDMWDAMSPSPPTIPLDLAKEAIRSSGDASPPLLTQGQVNILDLPNELLIKIIEKLDPACWKECMGVCRKFYGCTLAVADLTFSNLAGSLHRPMPATWDLAQLNGIYREIWSMPRYYDIMRGIVGFGIEFGRITQKTLIEALVLGARYSNQKMCRLWLDYLPTSNEFVRQGMMQAFRFARLQQNVEICEMIAKSRKLTQFEQEYCDRELARLKSPLNGIEEV